MVTVQKVTKNCLRFRGDGARVSIFNRAKKGMDDAVQGQIDVTGTRGCVTIDFVDEDLVGPFQLVVARELGYKPGRFHQARRH